MYYVPSICPALKYADQDLQGTQTLIVSSKHLPKALGLRGLAHGMDMITYSDPNTQYHQHCLVPLSSLPTQGRAPSLGLKVVYFKWEMFSP